jgi:hypothetical protein
MQLKNLMKGLFIPVQRNYAWWDILTDQERAARAEAQLKEKKEKEMKKLNKREERERKKQEERERKKQEKEMKNLSGEQNMTSIQSTEISAELIPIKPKTDIESKTEHATEADVQKIIESYESQIQKIIESYKSKYGIPKVASTDITKAEAVPENVVSFLKEIMRSDILTDMKKLELTATVIDLLPKPKKVQAWREVIQAAPIQNPKVEIKKELTKIEKQALEFKELQKTLEWIKNPETGAYERVRPQLEKWALNEAVYDVMQDVFIHKGILRQISLNVIDKHLVKNGLLRRVIVEVLEDIVQRRVNLIKLADRIGDGDKAIGAIEIDYDAIKKERAYVEEILPMGYKTKIEKLRHQLEVMEEHVKNIKHVLPYDPRYEVKPIRKIIEENEDEKMQNNLDIEALKLKLVVIEDNLDDLAEKVIKQNDDIYYLQRLYITKDIEQENKAKEIDKKFQKLSRTTKKTKKEIITSAETKKEKKSREKKLNKHKKTSEKRTKRTITKE